VRRWGLLYVTLWLGTPGCSIGHATPIPHDGDAQAPEPDVGLSSRPYFGQSAPWWSTKPVPPTLSQLSTFYGKGRWHCHGKYGSRSGDRWFELSYKELDNWVAAQHRFDGDSMLPKEAHEYLGVQPSGQYVRLGVDAAGGRFQLTSQGWEYDGVWHFINWTGKYDGPLGQFLVTAREKIEHSLHPGLDVLSVTGTITPRSDGQQITWGETCTRSDRSVSSKKKDSK
jgi:hypothetical protein